MNEGNRHDDTMNGLSLDGPGSPEYVAAVMAFPASNDARFVTVPTLPVEGGMSASNNQPPQRILRMPGTFSTVYLVAFDLDERDQPIPAFGPRIAADQDTALDEAEQLANTHAGVAVWRRDSSPAVGEEDEPVPLLSIGRIGDFN